MEYFYVLLPAIIAMLLVWPIAKLLRYILELLSDLYYELTHRKE